MIDVVSPLARARMMANIHGKNTKPEISLRHSLHRLGFRYNLHPKYMPGKPDLLFPKWQAVIFINGCFWHRHENCKLAASPKSRVEFWTEKFEKNILRDRENIRKLHEQNWRVGIVWECSTRSRLDEVVIEVASWLKNKRSAYKDFS
jgi:DNA mismatch endonuclease (patch repair protein)